MSRVWKCYQNQRNVHNAEQKIAAFCPMSQPNENQQESWVHAYGEMYVTYDDK